MYVGGNFGGIIHGQDISTGFTAEGIIGYKATKHTAYQLVGMYGAEYNSWLMAEGLLKLPIGRFITPYLLVGAGYTHLPNNNAGVEIGGGVNLNITQDVSLLAQYKYIQTFGSNTPYANVISGGITYYFCT
ncbi:porin family protein [Francisellaceae bacterium]|nr:porin family protein [Francisellaceae bacterium]